MKFLLLFPSRSFRLHILVYYSQPPLRTAWTCICWICAPLKMLGVAMAGGWLTSHSGLERYQQAPGMVSKLWRPLVACYKAALTSEPEGRRWSCGCMNDHRGFEAWGYAGQCLLYHSLSLLVFFQFSYVIFTPADEKIHFQNSLHPLVIRDTNTWNYILTCMNFDSFAQFFLFHETD